ncbi:hypothetical protein SLEP1_g24621 [Rubroshorea leprosula]|uniref:Retrotransposon gag domain-containing protein n=1 Tax=Rubroshorea leprosula TaxID=152421 RepID=A0AAV5JMH0_9ROSI|nr:hypothetical protein SLEP1_g24621 [Rubroshorea leprosula]
MPITKATSSHIVDGNQEPSQDDGREDLAQPINSVGTSQPHEVHIWAMDGNGSSTTRPNTSSPPVIAATNTNGAPPNLVDFTQGYVTMADLTTLLDKEHSKHGATLFQFYDGRKGNPVEHVNKFLDAMGAHAGDGDLCLREFLKPLPDRAYTWCTTLPPGFVRSWDEMIEQFHQKYFQSEKRITILDLHNTRQYTGEDIMVYVKRFRNLALDCYGGHVESFLVEICINNMFLEYHAILENIKINQLARLHDAARRTTIFVKAISTGKSAMKSIEKKTAVHTLVVSVRGQGQGQKRKDRDMAPPLPIPLTVEELDVLLNQWIVDGAITLPQAHREPNDDDKRNPKYCHYHHFVHHATMDCFSLRRMYHRGARQRATEAILFIANEARGEGLNVEAHASRAYLESSNAVTFIDKDMEAPYPDHRKPLYLSTQINSVGVRRALVNIGSSFNLVPLSTIIATGIPKRRIVKSPLSIVGFGNSSEHALGYIQHELKVGNEILDEHLDFSNEADHLIPPNKLPTLHEAQPALTSIEPFEAVDLRDDPANPRHVHISTTLFADERAKLVKLLRECKDVFAWNYDEMPGLDLTLVSHSLNVDPSMKLVVQPNCAFHPEVTLKIKEELEKLLATRFIKPTKKLTWLANIVPVRKKNGQIRCCVNFHDLNKACPKDEFSVPNMDVLMDNTAGCEMYSVMDGNNGNNRVCMCPSDVEKTAFRTRIVNFYYVVMPFGLKNAGATYQRVMEIKEEWTLYFDGSSPIEGARAGVVLRNDKGHDMVFSLKLDFSARNTIESDPWSSLRYLRCPRRTSCAISFFQPTPGASIRYEQIPRTKNRLADALTTIALRVPMAKSPFSIEIVQRERPIYHSCESVLLEIPDHVD